MAENQELLFGSHLLKQNVSVCSWNYNTGNIEHVYKSGGTALLKSLRLLSDEYVMTADQDKPLLHIWPVNSQEQIKNVRFIMPEVINCLDVDYSNSYLIAGIGLKLYMWHLNSGRLLSILQKHYQPITCVKYSHDGSYIVVAGQDGLLVVYKSAEVAAGIIQNVSQCEPLYSKMDHSSRIADLCIGGFKLQLKVATVSYDKTCRIYMLCTGELLLTLIFHHELSAVLFDCTCWNIFIGDLQGTIQRISLKTPPRTLEHHIDLPYKDSFIGHKKKITCLALNLDNQILASGSEDSKILIWNIPSRSQLREIECSGTITNLTFSSPTENFKVQTLVPKVVLNPLQKNIDTDLTTLVVHADPNPITFDDEEEYNDTLENAQSEINNLTIINKQLYDAFIDMAMEYTAKKT